MSYKSPGLLQMQRATRRNLLHGDGLKLSDELIEHYARQFELLCEINGRFGGSFQGFIETMEARRLPYAPRK